MINAGFRWALFFARKAISRNPAGNLRQRSQITAFFEPEVLSLRRKSAERIRILWICAGFSMALICVCAAPMVVAQDSTQAKAESTVPSEDATVHRRTATSNGKAAAHPGVKTQAHRRRSRQASSSHGRRRTVARGQRKIDPERAQEIQEALIREHYLTGTATGTWNQASEDAMRRYQADHGWQSKTVPDSRALISLGLGPSHDHLLNPESAMTSEPSSARDKQSASASAQPASLRSSSSTAPGIGADPAPAAKNQSNQVPVSQETAADPARPQ
jgi:hypothetical protein